MTGMEVAERKSVMRFLFTISLSALPGSSKDEDRAESWLLKSSITELWSKGLGKDLGRLELKLIGEENVTSPDRLDCYLGN